MTATEQPAWVHEHYRALDRWVLLGEPIGPPLTLAQRAEWERGNAELAADIALDAELRRAAAVAEALRSVTVVVLFLAWVASMLMCALGGWPPIVPMGVGAVLFGVWAVIGHLGEGPDS